MIINNITLLGLLAGAVTSIGFLPQLIKSYQTKKLEDVSYGMPLVLAIGMSLWFIYGVLQADFAIIVANSFGIFCSILLIVMKKLYS